MTNKVIALLLLILPFISCIDPNEAAMLPPDEYRFYTDLQRYEVGDTVALKCGYYRLSYGEETSREIEEDSVEFLDTDEVSPADVRVVFDYAEAQSGEIQSLDATTVEVVSKAEIAFSVPGDLQGLFTEFSIRVVSEFLIPQSTDTRHYGYENTLPLELTNP